MHTPVAPPAYNPTTVPSATKKHDKYYHEDGNIVIQAGDTLFRVWDGVLRRHAASFPLVDKDGAPNSDEHPLVLHNIASSDFERLLWILYPPVIGQCLATTSTDWTAVLKLSSLFGLVDVRTLAIRELGKLSLDPVEKIALQQTYAIEKNWAGDAFVALCTRGPPLEIEEGKKLGIEMTVLVAGAREKLDKWGRKKPEEVLKIVKEVFDVTVEKAA
ncbi:hypothetical protein MKEN_01132300 [Mycena kentingensis (nom. inval.)]|nr:hypothetical protein MKEN_01132300 [Mycena kentingensis (nom. inval.)]